MKNTNLSLFSVFCLNSFKFRRTCLSISLRILWKSADQKVNQSIISGDCSCQRSFRPSRTPKPRPSQPNARRRPSPAGRGLGCSTNPLPFGSDPARLHARWPVGGRGWPLAGLPWTACAAVPRRSLSTWPNHTEITWWTPTATQSLTPLA